MINKLREKTLVTVKNEVEINEYPFCNDLPLVYLGEIANMPEHGIFIGKSGKCYFGYHIWNFRELLFSFESTTLKNLVFNSL